jgi:transposase
VLVHSLSTNKAETLRLPGGVSVPFRLIRPDGVPALQRFHERPRKPAPKEVLMAWAQAWAKEGVAVDWKKLLPPKGPPKGFQVLPRRWVVERKFSGIDHNRRMSKDYERLCASGEAFVHAAMSRLMMRRLTRT